MLADEAIKQKYEKLNNESLPDVAHDKQARIGCKGKEKFGYGYKKHASVDMQSGFINKVAVTPAKKATAKKQCHLRAIKKNNMKGKIKEEDRWFSHLRSQ